MASSRDRYFDTLRAVAIVRVVVFHAFPGVALELAFPSMGVMFALGGSLMVTSLKRSTMNTLRNRLRRLLPALWVMAGLLVPLMVMKGWDDRPSFGRLLLWVLPIADPPYSQFGAEAGGVLWYLVTYLWLVLLSPVLLKLYRRWRLATVLLPLLGLALLVHYQHLLPGDVSWVMQNILGYASCWVLGFAHREGDLARIKPVVVLGLAGAAVGGALWWALKHPGDEGFNLTAIPVAYAIYSMGFVLFLLRWQPTMAWLARLRPVDRFVTMINNRAVTIYLWHNVAITIAVALFGPLKLWMLPSQALAEAVAFSIALATLAGFVLALGWVEDVAARRLPRLSPLPARTPAAAVPAPRPAPRAEPVAQAVG